VQSLTDDQIHPLAIVPPRRQVHLPRDVFPINAMPGNHIIGMFAINPVFFPPFRTPRFCVLIRDENEGRRAISGSRVVRRSSQVDTIAHSLDRHDWTRSRTKVRLEMG